MLEIKNKIDKVYLVDGMSLVFRAYHAMSRAALQTPSGEPTSAVFGFANIITSLLDKENPEHIAVIFDVKEPTFRHERYDQYKANRDAFPEDLEPQLLRIKQLLDYLAIPRIESAGFEADDIIGTLSKHASEQEIEVICLTSDKDLYQLVNNYVKLYKPTKVAVDNFEVVDREGVYTKFGVTPDKVIDVLALIGDASDNIPGVKGIGEKTAIPLIQKYGSVENLYEHLSEIDKEAVRSKLENDRDMAFLSKELVTIKQDVPVDIDIEKCRWNHPNGKELDEFFKELGFNQLRKKWQQKLGLAQEETKAEEAQIDEFVSTHKKIGDTDIDYNLINEKQAFAEMLAELDSAEILSVDLETDSLDKQSCNIVGIALCAKEGRAFYIAIDGDIVPVVHKVKDSSQSSLFDTALIKDSGEEYKPQRKGKYLPTDWVINNIKPLLEKKSLGKIGQNIKFDAYILKRYGINVSPVVFDSMVASYLLNPDGQHNLDALSKVWLGYEPIPITSLIGTKKGGQITMRDVDPELISDYASEDADLALKLRNKLYPELKAQNLLRLAEEVEFPLIEVLVKMESNGVAIDTSALGNISKEATREITELKRKIFEEAGTEFNIDSPKQIGHVLFEKMLIPVVSKTKTGYSTDVQVLTQLSESYPIAQLILDYRQIVKLKSTYVDALPKLINPQTGRIHTNFNQTITSTGRLSSTEPNMQNIPIRTELGKEIRKAFVPQDSDSLILSADYSQIELRIMAYICEDRQLIEAFKNGLDIHASTAANLFNIPLDKVDSDMRRVAKTINFGIMYGLGSFGLSQRIGLGRRESQEIIDNYFKKFPGIKKYIEMTIKDTQKKGYAESLLGRKRVFPGINSKNRTLRTAAERAAINMPVQGTAADMMKLAMVRVDAAMKKNKLHSLMTLQVHDELVFEALPGEVELLSKIVKKEMEEAYPLGDVPILVEVGKGKNWFEAH